LNEVHALVGVSKPNHSPFAKEKRLTISFQKARAARCRAALRPLAKAPGGD
jgi:hypothetical protein